LRAMSGYAGPSPLRNRKPGESMSREYARNLKRECVGLVVGPVVVIVKIRFCWTR
jgi:hypothetical protein